MNSREKILAAVNRNQPAMEPLPAMEDVQGIRFDNPSEKFAEVLKGIGGTVMACAGLDEVTAYVQTQFREGTKYISVVKGMNGIASLDATVDPHTLADVEVAVIPGAFGVAENSAVWVNDASLGIRALPFICQHLVIVLHENDFVHNMHEAYDRIGAAQYGFGVFIAGPSKTADIEQSLVLGAHGAKSLTVCLVSG